MPDKFNGKMEHWEEWSWSVKKYVALFKAEATEVMEGAELLEIRSLMNFLRECSVTMHDL